MDLRVILHSSRHTHENQSMLCQCWRIRTDKIIIHCNIPVKDHINTVCIGVLTPSDHDKPFTASNSFVIHQRIHSGDKPYKCYRCEKAFTASSTLVIHQTIHSGDKPYKCNRCDLAFKASSILVIHQRIHSGDKLLQ